MEYISKYYSFLISYPVSCEGKWMSVIYRGCDVCTTPHLVPKPNKSTVYSKRFYLIISRFFLMIFFLSLFFFLPFRLILCISLAARYGRSGDNQNFNFPAAWYLGVYSLFLREMEKKRKNWCSRVCPGVVMEKDMCAPDNLIPIYTYIHRTSFGIKADVIMI